MTVIKEPMERSLTVDGESFWVLQKPGTQETVMSVVAGKAEGPITFASEEDAIRFANLYDVDHGFVPVYHTMKLRKDN